MSRRAVGLLFRVAPQLGISGLQGAVSGELDFQHGSLLGGGGLHGMASSELATSTPHPIDRNGLAKYVRAVTLLDMSRRPLR